MTAAVVHVGPWSIDATPVEVAEIIPYSDTKNLWIKFEAPTATKVTTQQTIKLMISAE